MQFPLAHLDASVIEGVPVTLWRQVFDAVGWLDSLATKKSTLKHDDILDALANDEPSDGLLQAIEALHTLGTEEGRDAIVAAMNDRRVPIGALPTKSGEGEFALHLFLAQRSDATLVDVFARAQTHIQEVGSRRRYNEFMGKEARTVSHLNARQDALHAATESYCKDNDLGEHVQVRAFEDDGTYVFQVIRSHRTKKPLAVVPGHTARATIEYRPVHADLIRYDASVGRIQIAARAASIVEYYRRTLGRVLFEDETFFTGEAVCSLRVLQEGGRSALSRHDILGIGNVRMTECVWERGDRDVMQIRSSDCFRYLEEVHLPLNTGEILQAKFKIDVIGKSTRPVTVNVRVPSGIEITNKVHEKVVLNYLTAIGIRNAPARPANQDLWTLHPWRHAASQWVGVFKGAKDVLVKQAVLTPVRLSSVPSSDNPGSGRVYTAHPVPGSDYYGISHVPEIASKSLSPTDLDGLELNPESLRLYLQSELHLRGPSVPWDRQEVLDLGVLDIAEHEFRLFYALRAPSIGIGARMRELAAGKNAVLLIPTRSDYQSELPKVVLEEALPTLGEVKRGVIAVCGLAGTLPAIHTAPDRARLVVDTRIGKIWVDGIEISGLGTETHPFLFVAALAKEFPSRISVAALMKLISPHRDDGGTAVRQAKTDAKKQITSALEKAGRSLDGQDLFPTGPPGSYRCSVTAHAV